MKIKKIWIACVSLAFLPLSISKAGTWVSSGGELLRDSKNAWFLQNTKRISYCVKVDHDNFGLAREDVSKRIRESFEYWRKEFANEQSRDANLEAKVATQTLVETECNDKTDIAFQFGVLTAEQIAKLERPGDFVSFAMRTDYDRVNLRAKGFVYVAPPKGPLKPDSWKNAAEDVWSNNNGGALLHVLAHEFGHVFGLSDGDKEVAFDIMSTGYVEEVSGRYAAEYSKLPLPKYFSRFWSGEISGTDLKVSNERIAKFFFLYPGVCASNDVLNIVVTEMDPQSGHRVMVVKCIDNIKRKITEIGRAELTIQASAKRQAVRVWLPKEQRVIPNASERVANTVKHHQLELRGIYYSTPSGRSRPIFVQMPNPTMGINSIGGEMDGEMLLNLQGAWVY